MLETFIECKNERHEKEDLPFTDLRNWEIENLKKQENEPQTGFEERLRKLKDRVKETCDKGDAFWKDMDEEEVKMEFGILIDYFIARIYISEPHL